MATCRQWLEGLPSPKGVLANVQRNGRESLLNTGLPTKNLESWRLTDLKRLENLFSLPISTNKESIANVNSQSWANEPNNALRIVLEPHGQSLESMALLSMT